MQFQKEWVKLGDKLFVAIQNIELREKFLRNS